MECHAHCFCIFYRAISSALALSDRVILIFHTLLECYLLSVAFVTSPGSVSCVPVILSILTSVVALPILYFFIPGPPPAQVKFSHGREGDERRNIEIRTEMR